MAIGDLLAGVLQGSKDYQTFRNNRAAAAGSEIANDQTAFENELKQDATLSDEVFTYGLQNGYIDKYTFEFDKDKVKAGVAAGDPVAKKFVTDIANRISDQDRFTISGVEEGEDGYYRFPVQNKDGSPGVITDDGTSNNDSPVTALDLDDLVDNTDQVFRARVLPFQTKTDLVSYHQNLGFDRINAEEQAKYLRQEADLVAGLQGNPAEQRNVISTLAQAPDPAVKAQITAELSSMASQQQPEDVANRNEIEQQLIQKERALRALERPGRKKPEQLERRRKLREEVEQLKSQLPDGSIVSADPDNAPIESVARLDALRAQRDALNPGRGTNKKRAELQREIDSLMERSPDIMLLRRKQLDLRSPDKMMTAELEQLREREAALLAELTKAENQNRRGVLGTYQKSNSTTRPMLSELDQVQKEIAKLSAKPGGGTQQRRNNLIISAIERDIQARKNSTPVPEEIVIAHGKLPASLKTELPEEADIRELGNTPPDPAEAQAIAEYGRKNNVTSIDDLRRIPTDAQLVMLNAIAASTPEARREAVRKELYNRVFTGDPNMTREQRVTLKQNERRLNQNDRQLDQAERKIALSEATEARQTAKFGLEQMDDFNDGVDVSQEIVDDVQNLLIGEDGTSLNTDDDSLRQAKIKVSAAVRRANSFKGPKQAGAATGVFDAVLPFIGANIEANGRGLLDVYGRFQDLFRPENRASLDGAAYDLRVETKRVKRGKQMIDVPVAFYFEGGAGEIFDGRISVDDLRNELGISPATIAVLAALPSELRKTSGTASTGTQQPLQDLQDAAGE
jgi:hypothetical protein